MLLIEIFESSALVFATLINSLRLSSVNCGKLTRITVPSPPGFTPRSDSLIDFYIAGIAPLSNGEIIAVLASGT